MYFYRCVVAAPGPATRTATATSTATAAPVVATRTATSTATAAPGPATRTATATSTATAAPPGGGGGGVPNDNVANAAPLQLGVGVGGSSVGATTQAGEPGAAKATLWYTFTTAVAGQYTLNTGGSAFDTSIAVYRYAGGAAFGGLVAVSVRKF